MAAIANGTTVWFSGTGGQRYSGTVKSSYAFDASGLPKADGGEPMYHLTNVSPAFGNGAPIVTIRAAEISTTA